jgi:hypothetical protein
MAGFGSEENPYIESFTGRIVEVGWGAVKAVKWKTSAFLDGNRDRVIPDSDVGVLSVWLYFREDSGASGWQMMIAGSSNTGSPNFILDVEPGGWSDNFPDGGPVNVSIRIWLMEAAVEESVQKFVVFEDTVSITQTDKWFHIFAKWNTSASSISIVVNGQAEATYTWPGDVYLTSSWGGPPLTVGWASDPLPDWRTIIFPGSFRGIGDSPFSVADLWMDVTHTDLDVEDFINLETGKPRNLGEFGEKPITPEPTEEEPNPEPVLPALFFHRAGAPETFLENRGYAGEFTLVGDEPEVEPINPSFEVVP